MNINDLTTQVSLAKEAAKIMNKAHNDYRLKFEHEKYELFREHKNEVKSWQRDLGDMTRMHVNLEKKLNTLLMENERLKSGGCMELKCHVIESLAEYLYCC